MTPILEAAVELQEFLVEKKWPFCIIGGLAVMRWGTPRTTQDVDVSLFVEFGKEPDVIESIFGRFRPRLNGAREFALESRVVLAYSANGIELDIALAQFEFEKSMIERATLFEFDQGASLLTISAEDLLVLKALAGRERDWNDVRGIITSNQSLNLEQINSQLNLFEDIAPERCTIARLNQIVAELNP
jgi:predicted nucleotidyltransferase